MLLITLGLFFHIDIINCDEIVKANFNRPLRTVHEATRNQNFMGSVTAIIWNSTPGIDQTTWITPRYPFLSTPTGHETYHSTTGQALKGPSFTGMTPEANRRNRKNSNRQLKNDAFRDQPRQQDGTTLLEISRRRNSGRRPRKPHRIKSTQTLSKKRLFPNLLLSDGMASVSDDDNTSTDNDGESQAIAGARILRIHDVSKKFWSTDQTETPTAASVTQFLRQNTVVHPYFEMIEVLQEGYMMVFLIELTRLISTKEGKAVRDVVKHTEKIVYGLYRTGQLLWLGKPLIDVTMKFAKLLKEWEIDVVQKHAANLHHMLSQRNQELSVEVNTILEYADMLYEDDEGRLLFDALKEFAAFPNIRLTGYWVCNGLIHNFLRPYRRLKDSQQRQELIHSMNLKLQSYNYKKIPVRSGHVIKSAGASDENQPSPQKEAVTQIEPHSDTTRSPRRRKRKRHHRSRKRKRERKRRRKHRQRPQYSQRYSQKYNLGSVTTRTSVQKRFRVKTK